MITLHEVEVWYGTIPGEHAGASRIFIEAPPNADEKERKAYLIQKAREWAVEKYGVPFLATSAMISLEMPRTALLYDPKRQDV